MDHKEIEKKVRAKQPITNEEYLHLLRNNEHAFWGFLITNNPGNVNDTLRHKITVPFTELGFYPNKQALTRQIEMMLQKKDDADLMEVLKNFELKTTGLDEDFIHQFSTEFLS